MAARVRPARRRPAPRSAALVAGAAAVLALAGCGGAGDDAQATASVSGAATVRLEDGYVRAADGGMTAAFGLLVNDGEEDVTVVAAESDIASTMELHEVVTVDGEQVMQPKEGGLVVPAGGEHVLEPGADHVMFLDLTGPLAAGDTVTWTMTTEDGTEIEVTAPVRDVAAGDESYEPGTGAGHDMGGTGEMGDMGTGDAGGEGDDG